MRFTSLSAVFLCLVLTGCAMTPTATNVATGGGQAIEGSVYGGQQPINLAHVYLMQANTTGYSQPSVSLLNAALTGNSDSVGAYVTTNTRGFFRITGDYTCTPGTQVYLLILQGDAGGGNNTAAGEMGVFGQCPAAGNFLATIPFVQINEVTTVATAYALAGFAIDALHVSSSGTTLAQTGIANAFANASNIASVVTAPNTGSLSSTPGGGTVPAALVNTLGDIIASCVNSTGPGSPACSVLLGDTQTTDTASALISIAHNPAANVGDLFGLVPAIPPFVPALTKQPTSFILPLSFTGGGLSGGYYAAVDASGDVWFTNYSSNTVSELNPLGVALSPAAGFTGGGLKSPNGIVLDASGNAYVANSGALSEFSSTGAALTPATGYTAGGTFGTLESLSFDASGNLWVADYSNRQLRKVTVPGGLALAQSYATGAAGPVGLAVNAQNEIWATNFDNSTLLALPLGAANATFFAPTQINKPIMIAIDATQTEWLVNDNTSSVSHFSSAGSALNSTAYTGGGLATPFGIAIDGAGRVWVTNNGPNGSVSELDITGSPLSPATGFVSTSLSVPDGIAVDGSGDVWVTNQNNGVVTEFIGAATPVVTPLAAASLGTRP